MSSIITVYILTTVVACGEIHELFVGCDTPADVGGEISLFVDDR
jgi:hypothetical protein